MTKPAQSATGAVFHGYKDESGGLLAKAQSLVSQAFERLSRETADRQAIWELNQLDDHALRDIGIHRSEIEAQVRGRK